MKTYWLVEHFYEIDGCEIVRTIGVFSNKPKALAAKRSVRKLPGFRRHPHGFYVGKIFADQESWGGGFTTLNPRD